MSKNKIKFIFIPLLLISLVVNLVSVYLYLFKYLPYFRETKSKLENFQNQSLSNNCKKVYSKTEGKVVCLTKDELKSETLSKCSINFKENLNENILKVIKSVSELEKLRELSIKMCMQENGLDF